MSEETPTITTPSPTTSPAAIVEATVKNFSPTQKAFEEIEALSSDGEEAIEEATAPEKVSEEAPTPEVTPEAKSETATPKIIIAKKGEDDIEISDDTVFTVKVNKQDEAVPLKDLIRNYQGKVPWEKHYHETMEHERSVKQKEFEIKQKETSFAQKTAKEQAEFKEIVELAHKNPSEALMLACMRAGKSPTEVFRAVIEQSKATVAQLEQLSPEQEEFLIAQKGLEYDKYSISEEKKAGEEAKARQAEVASLTQHIQGRCSELKITAAEYQASQNLLQSAVEDGSVKLDGMNSQHVADLIIENIIQNDRPRFKLANLILAADPKAEFTYQDITELQAHLGGDLTKYSEEALNEIITEVFGSNGASEADEPVQAIQSADSSRELATKPTSPKIPQKKAKPRMEVGDEDFDPLSMDDIKKSYRK